MRLTSLITMLELANRNAAAQDKTAAGAHVAEKLASTGYPMTAMKPLVRPSKATLDMD